MVLARDQLADIFTKPLDESRFCKLRNELNIIDFSNVARKLAHVAYGSFMHSLFLFFEFLEHFWAIYEFSWFNLIYFWFIVLTHSYEPLDGVHASFEIFGILFEQWSQFIVEIVKVGKILGCLKFGRADGPRVRGGRSAIHDVFHQRLWSAENWSADSPPMDRGRSARCTGKLRIHRWVVYWASRGRSAKGPRMVRSWWEKWNRGSSSRVWIRFFQRRTVRQGNTDGPRLDRLVGSARLDL